MSAETFTCADCGKTFPVQTSGGTGYARTADGKTICYACADIRERAELKDRSKPFCAYLSSDGQRVTTWTGGELMRVTYSRPCRLTRQSFTHSRESFRSICATDCHGGQWYGRGSPGIVIKLRARKS
jgi:hypothetical protein